MFADFREQSRVHRTISANIGSVNTPRSQRVQISKDSVQETGACNSSVGVSQRWNAQAPGSARVSVGGILVELTVDLDVGEEDTGGGNPGHQKVHSVSARLGDQGDRNLGLQQNRRIS